MKTSNKISLIMWGLGIAGVMMASALLLAAMGVSNKAHASDLDWDVVLYKMIDAESDQNVQSHTLAYCGAVLESDLARAARRVYTNASVRLTRPHYPRMYWEMKFMQKNRMHRIRVLFTCHHASLMRDE